MTRLESSIMREIRQYLTREGYYWSNLPAGIVGHRQGDPDMIACIEGRYVALEGKTRTGRQSPRQKEVENLILKSGGIYEIIRNVDDVKIIVEKIKNEAW